MNFFMITFMAFFALVLIANLFNGCSFGRKKAKFASGGYGSYVTQGEGPLCDPYGLKDCSDCSPSNRKIYCKDCLVDIAAGISQADSESCQSFDGTRGTGAIADSCDVEPKPLSCGGVDCSVEPCNGDCPAIWEKKLLNDKFRANAITQEEYQTQMLVILEDISECGNQWGLAETNFTNAACNVFDASIQETSGEIGLYPYYLDKGTGTEYKVSSGLEIKNEGGVIASPQIQQEFSFDEDDVVGEANDTLVNGVIVGVTGSAASVVVIGAVTSALLGGGAGVGALAVISAIPVVGWIIAGSVLVTAITVKLWQWIIDDEPLVVTVQCQGQSECMANSSYSATCGSQFATGLSIKPNIEAGGAPPIPVVFARFRLLHPENHGLNKIISVNGVNLFLKNMFGSDYTEAMQTNVKSLVGSATSNFYSKRKATIDATEYIVPFQAGSYCLIPEIDPVNYVMYTAKSISAINDEDEEDYDGVIIDSHKDEDKPGLFSTATDGTNVANAAFSVPKGTFSAPVNIIGYDIRYDVTGGYDIPFSIDKLAGSELVNSCFNCHTVGHGYNITSIGVDDDGAKKGIDAFIRGTTMGSVLSTDKNLLLSSLSLKLVNLGGDIGDDTAGLSNTTTANIKLLPTAIDSNSYRDPAKSLAEMISYTAYHNQLGDNDIYDLSGYKDGLMMSKGNADGIQSRELFMYKNPFIGTTGTHMQNNFDGALAPMLISPNMEEFGLTNFYNVGEALSEGNEDVIVFDAREAKCAKAIETYLLQKYGSTWSTDIAKTTVDGTNGGLKELRTFSGNSDIIDKVGGSGLVLSGVQVFSNMSTKYKRTAEGWIFKGFVNKLKDGDGEFVPYPGVFIAGISGSFRKFRELTQASYSTINDFYTTCYGDFGAMGLNSAGTEIEDLNAFSNSFNCFDLAD